MGRCKRAIEVMKKRRVCVVVKNGKWAPAWFEVMPHWWPADFWITEDDPVDALLKVEQMYLNNEKGQ